MKKRTYPPYVLRDEPMANLATILEITRLIAKADPTNDKAAAVVAWADSLGHTPNDQEFAAFCSQHGINLVKGYTQ